MAAPYRIQPSHKQNVSSISPSSDQGGEVLVEEKKAPIRIVPPTGSLKYIEKNIVKRKTQLFEQGDISANQVGGDAQSGINHPVPSKGIRDPSPTYKPSFEASSKGCGNSDNLLSPKAGETVPAYPYKAKPDARVSKAIGLEALVMVEQLNTKKGTPPDRPKLPPSPISRDKPRYPFKPSVENEIDAHGKVNKKLGKHLQSPAQATKLVVNTNLGGNCDKNPTSPKSPSPPVRPPPPKFSQTDKKVSTLIAHKSKLFESQAADASGTEKPSETARKHETRAKQRLSSTQKDFEEVKIEGGVPKLSTDVHSTVNESSAHNVKQLVKSSEHPEYSKVNKPKKVTDRDLKSQKERNGSAESGLSQRPNRTKNVTSAPPGTISEAGNDIHTARSAVSEKPTAAPSKPPRTFAHDDYMKVKADRHQQKKKQHVSAPSPLAAVHNYEEIANSTGAPPPPPGKPSRMQFKSCDFSPSGIYEEVAIPQVKPEVLPKPRTNTYQDIDEKKTYTYDKLDESSLEPKPAIATKPPTPPLKPGHVQFSTSKTESIDQSEKDTSRWEKGYVQIKKPSQRLKKEPIISKKAVSNPAYEPWDHDCIPIKTVYKGATLKRYKSDEFLYAENTSPKHTLTGFVNNEEPVYHDPADVLKGPVYVNSHGVAIDGTGYAVPDVGLNAAKPNPKRYQKREVLQRTGTLAYGTQRRNKSKPRTSMRSNPSVKEKVSEAYAVLRRRTIRTEDGAEADTTGCYRLEDSSESDSEVESDEHQKHLEYVSTTKLRLKNPQYKSVYEKAMFKSPAVQLAQHDDQDRPQVRQLFEYGLIVGLEEIGDTKQYKPKVLHTFPYQDSLDLGIISSFCFPDAGIWRPVSHYRTETFSFVLTASDGSRQYGYCRRFLPSNETNVNRLPEVFCLVSSICAWNFYADLLMELQEVRKVSVHQAQNLLQLAYAKPMPHPGEEVWIRCPGESSSPKTVIVKRSADDKLDKVSPSVLLERLSVENLLKVFSSLLLERRLIFVAQHLGTLTEAIHALLSLLYPFTWQHTFIPILPGELLEICDAPTPYVVGALAGHYPQIQEMDIDDVMIIDLNNDSIIKSMGDEETILPKKLQKALKVALKTDPTQKDMRDMTVVEAFLRMFVEIVGHYADFINVQQDGVKEFQRDAFVREVSSKSIRMFLEWFTETQMFEIYVTTKMDSPHLHIDGLFEERLEEYREEMEKLVPSVKQNIKHAGKRFINFFKESGGKIKKVFV